MNNVKIEIHDRCLDTRLKSVDNWKFPKVEYKALHKFFDELQLGRVNKGKKISEARIAKYIDLLKTPLTSFNKPSTSLKVKDVEKFEKALSSGEIKSAKNIPYSTSSKVGIRKALKIYLKWRLGKSKALKLTDWLDTRDVKQTPNFLKESEIESLYNSCKTSAERFLVAVLFDSGARIEEFLNIRFEDIELPNANQNYARITLKEEYSKTAGRVVVLFWKYSTDAVRQYTIERQKEGIRSDEPIYNKSYDAVRFFLQRFGKKVLNKNVHCHLFRHSSATYYANKLNRQQLCIRYGWAFSSRMPDIYIARAGVDMAELEEKMSSTEISELKSSVERQKQEHAIMQSKMKIIEDKLEKFVVELEKLSTIPKKEE